MVQEPVQSFAGAADAAEEPSVGQKAGRRHRTSGDADEDRTRERPVDRDSERRDSPTAPKFESAATRDRGHSAEATAPKEVGQVGDRERGAARTLRQGADRKGGRNGARCAHPKPLTDGELVGHMDREAALPAGEEPLGDIARDGGRNAEVAGNPDAPPTSGVKLRARHRTELENDARAGRAAAARIAGGGAGREDPGDVPRREGDRVNSPRTGHEIPSPTFA
jgi:hypothetical protein